MVYSKINNFLFYLIINIMLSSFLINKYKQTFTSFTWHCLMRTKQKMHPNFSIVVMEVNKLSTHLGAHPTVHVNEVNVICKQTERLCFFA
jgi:hypothetical protein